MLFLPISGENGKKEEAYDASNPDGLRTLNLLKGNYPLCPLITLSAVIYSFLPK